MPVIREARIFKGFKITHLYMDSAGSRTYLSGDRGGWPLLRFGYGQGPSCFPQEIINTWIIMKHRGQSAPHVVRID